MFISNLSNTRFSQTWVLLLFSLCTLACGDPETIVVVSEIGIEIVVNAPDPNSYDLSIIAGEKCASPVQTAQHSVDASEPNTLINQQAFAIDNSEFPPQQIGDISPGTYAISVIGRDELCEPTAYGCNVFEVPQKNSISIEITPLSPTLELRTNRCPENQNRCRSGVGICIE